MHNGVIDMGGETVERPKAAQRIHEAAKALFHRQGIRATGVDEVCRAAEATKMSLYRAYPSKDALVAAILSEDAAEFAAGFDAITGSAADPIGKLRALVEAKAAKIACPDGVAGCPMLMAQAEFRDPGHPTHQVVVDFKRAMTARIVALAAEAGARDPALLGEGIAVAMEGALATVPYLGGERSARLFRRLALPLIEEAEAWAAQGSAGRDPA